MITHMLVTERRDYEHNIDVLKNQHYDTKNI